VRPRVSVEWEQDGGFSIRNCPPGTYALTLRWRDSAAPVLDVADIVVKEGEPCADPRLRDIDLAGPK